MRGIGEQVRRACEVIEMYGPCGYAVVTTETDIERPNASKCCIRAVGYGLMTVEKPENRGQTHSFALYTVVPGWRERLGSFNMASRKRPEPVKEVAPRTRKRTAFSYINSVFGLGAA